MSNLLTLARGLVRAAAADAFRVVAPHARGVEDWASLRGERVLVVLGEAGSGKTSELELQAEALLSEGLPAFRLSLEDLARDGAAGGLPTNADRRRLRDWRAEGTTPAWFFLDALDESKLRGHTLATSLRKFAGELEEVLHRVHVVLSSRPSDWRNADEASARLLVAEILGKQGTAASSPAIVELAPLTPEQVLQLLARDASIRPEEVRRAADEGDAWSLLTRPLDVRWLASHWKRHRRLGTRREFVAASIEERLEDRAERTTVLTKEKARSGARTLALACLLTGALHIALAGDRAPELPDGALAPGDVLEHWSRAEVADLLRRGIFDSATYGRVRFHERSVQDFLAAEALQDLVGRGLGKRDLELTLFRRSGHRVVLPNRLAGTMAWLAGVNADVRGMALRHAPSHLLDEGDPSAFSSVERTEILRAYVARYSDRDRVPFGFDGRGLGRFGSPAMASTIVEMLDSPTTPPHGRELLLEIGASARLEAVGDAALRMASAQDTPSSLRPRAIASAAAVGERHCTLLSALLGTSHAREPNVAAALCDALFPTAIGADAAVELLVGTECDPMDEPRLVLAAAMLHLRCAPEQLGGLLDALARAVGAPGISSDARVPASPESHAPAHVGDAADGSPAVDTRRAWLGGALANALSRALSTGSATREDAASVVEILLALEEHAEAVFDGGLRRVLKRDDTLRREVFWRRAVRLKRERRAGPRAIDMMRRLDASDVGWLSRDVVDRPHAWERVLAFSCRIAAGGGDASSPELDELAQQSDAAHPGDSISRHLQRRRGWVPPSFPWEGAQRRRASLRSRRDAAQKERSLAELLARVDGLRDGSDFAALHHLYAHPDAEQHAGHRARIEGVYGADIANAAVAGFRAIWRLHDSPRREDSEPGSIPVLTQLALAGLDADHAAGVAISELDEGLLRKAVTYATWQLNGFPAWLEACCLAHPDFIQEVFGRALTMDFQSAPGREGPDRILQKVTYGSQTVRRACAPIVGNLLREGEPPQLQVLLRVLQVLRASDGGASWIAPIVRARVSAARTAPPRFARWWVELLALDAGEALRELRHALAEAQTPDELMVDVLVGLDDFAVGIHPSGWDRHEGAALALGDRGTLTEVFRLAGTYVKAEDDLRHRGVYTPSPRDEAQLVRGALVSRLSSISGDATVLALDDLASDPALRAWRDRLRELADQRAVDDAGERVAPVGDVVALLRKATAMPGGTDDLLHVVLDALADVQHDLRHGEFSYREAFDPEKGHPLESLLQKYVADQLHVGSRGRYRIHREPDLADGTMPDIRADNPSCPSPVSIEMKVAERWTGPDLERALREQLAGHYLAARSSTHGVFLLCSAGEGKRWQTLSGEVLALHAFAEHLHGVAVELVAMHAGIEAIAIAVLDFRADASVSTAWVARRGTATQPAGSLTGGTTSGG